MKPLDNTAETLPYGISGTPFETVYKALRSVASQVWAVDPLVYRAGMGWGWYALNKPELLVPFRGVVTTALISAVAPMVKASQTDAELVEYLRQWREYTPAFPKLQNLYTLFGATVDIQPISDPESQTVLPVEDTTHAFYVRITSVDMSRPLTLSEAYDIAIKASPLGSRPFVYYAIESRIDTTAAPAPIQDTAWTFVTNNEIAGVPEPPPPVGLRFVYGGLISETSSSQYTVTIDEYLMSVEASLYGILPPHGNMTVDNISLYGIMPPIGGYVELYMPLPEVELLGADEYDGWLFTGGSTTTNVTISAGATVPLYREPGSSFPGRSSYPQAVVEGNVYRPAGYYQVVNESRTGLIPADASYSGATVFGVKNVSASSITVARVKVARCRDMSVDVVHVKDASDNLYNAFRYVYAGFTFYYVLDDVQTAWVSDLSSIGYTLAEQSIEVFFYLATDGSPKTFSANDYWASYIRNATDKALLESFGVPCGATLARDITGYTAEPVGLYNGDGYGDNGADMSNFYCAPGPSSTSTSAYYGICIWSRNAYSTGSVTWKCKITKT